jgi:hypothetical protein
VSEYEWEDHHFYKTFDIRNVKYDIVFGSAMVSYHGSILNYSIPRRIVIWVLVVVLPMTSTMLIAGLIPFFSWWPFLLIPILVIWMVAISFSGTVLKGHDIDFLDGEIVYGKGWTGGRIPERNIVKVYRVFYEDRDSIFLIFNEPGYKSHPNRCLSIEQIFRKKDRQSIFNELDRIGKRTGIEVIGSATINRIRSDKKVLDWVPV